MIILVFNGKSCAYVKRIFSSLQNLVLFLTNSAGDNSIYFAVRTLLVLFAFSFQKKMYCGGGKQQRMIKLSQASPVVLSTALIILRAP